jgi:hypothetical protein
MTDPLSGLAYAQGGARDVPHVARLKELAKEQGVPVPEMAPKAR